MLITSSNCNCLTIFVLLFMLCIPRAAGGFLAKDSANEAVNSSLTNSDQIEVEALSHYAWGYYLADSGKAHWDKANEQYLIAIERDPYSDFLIEEILRFWSIYASHDEADQIIRYLENIARRFPDAVSLNITVADAYIEKAQFKLARDLLVDVLRHVRWKEPFLIPSLVECYQRTGQYRRADKLLRNATTAKTFRGNYDIERIAAIFYDKVAKEDRYRISENKRYAYQTLAYEHALRAADAFLNNNAIDVNNETMELITILLTGNFTEQVITMLQSLRETGKRTVKTERLLAECYEAQNQADKALEVWKELSNQFPLNPFYHTRMGQILKLSQRYKDARLAFMSAYRLVESPLLAFEIATLFLLLNQPSDALEYARRASPDKLDTYLLLAHIYRDLGQPEKAIEVLTNAEYVQTGFNNPEFLTIEYYLTLATTYYTFERKEETIQTLERALKRYPDNPDANNFLGYYLADQNKDLHRAKKFILNALRVAPNNPAYLDSLAWVLYRQGHYREAAKKIDNALKVQGLAVDGVIYDHAGDIYFSLGRFEKAVEFWTKALERGVKETTRIKQKIQDAVSKINQ